MTQQTIQLTASPRRSRTQERTPTQSVTGNGKKKNAKINTYMWRVPIAEVQVCIKSYHPQLYSNLHRASSNNKTNFQEQERQKRKLPKGMDEILTLSTRSLTCGNPV